MLSTIINYSDRVVSHEVIDKSDAGTSSMRLLIYEKSYHRVKDRIEAVAPDTIPVLLRSNGSVHVDEQNIMDEDVAFDIAWASSETYLGGPSRAMLKLLRSNSALKWFQSAAAGLDHPVFAEVAESDAIMTRSNAQGIAIAEFILARVLELLHPVQERIDAQKRKAWDQYSFSDLYGKTWLIIGMGAIGNETAIRARAFGSRVIGVRRHPTGAEDVDEMISPDGLPDALPRADIVVLAAPLTDETRHMVDKDFLGKMRLKSILINVGRGGLVDEAALVESLEYGKPGFAVLDVFEEEPLPVVSPLWSHPDVTVSPHASAFTPLTEQRGDDVFIDNLERYVKGEPLRLVVKDF